MDADSTPRRILVVDDDEHLRRFIARGLSRVGFQPVVADSGSSGIALLREQRFDCVLCDLHMPDVDGLDVLRFAAGLSPRPPFIVLTGYGSVSVAVEAMKRGASDFLEKPVSIDELRATIQAVLSRPTAQSSRLSGKAKSEGGGGIIGSPAWLEPFLDALHRVANTDTTVLIEGETGTGKSVVAREIARTSQRASGPFIELNCAAIPEQLLENELFGHDKDAYTNATRSQAGRVELAAGGTLFLDEVGELKHDLQAKLLHVIQERVFTRVGSTQARRADVRFIAATNRDLPKAVEEGRFRADLYYRLNVVSLVLPPLRERPDDIPLLVEHFRRRIADRIKAEPPIFSTDTLRVLAAHKWPGNVRELENIVERMTVMHPGKVIPPSLLGGGFRDAARAVEQAVVQAAKGPPPAAGTPAVGAEPTPTGPLANPLFVPPRAAEPQSFHDAVKAYERAMIERALRNAGGNQTRAAKLLNMNRTTLIEKMKRYNIDDGATFTTSSPVSSKDESSEPPSDG